MTAVAFVCLIAFAALAQIIVLRYGLKNITYDMHTSYRLVECGQVFTITTVVENRKLLPVLFLRLSESFPESIELKTDGASIKQRRLSRMHADCTEISQTMYLLSNQRVSRTLEASFPKRGIQIFRTAFITGGDLLGIKERTKSIDFRYFMIVLPKRVDAPELQKAFGSFLGDMSAKRFIMEDPVLTLSFREYTGREPMKDISWSRSLRDGKLMVKQYDYTMELSVTVILNAEFSGEFDSDTFELTLSLARGVCEQLEKKKISYNFRTNLTSSGISGEWTNTADGLGYQHLMAILEGLGCASQYTAMSFPALIESAVSRAETARAHVLITPDMSEDNRRIIKKAENIICSHIFVINASEEVTP